MSLYTPMDLSDLIKSSREYIKVEVEGLTSTGDKLRVEFSCDSIGRMPNLSWSRVEGAKSYSIISYDPDAPIGIFYHLVAYNIPGNVNSVTYSDLHKIAILLPNTGGKRDWYPLCPPRGHKPHRYYFIVLALSEELPRNIKDLRGLIASMRGKVLAYGWNMGVFSR
ncbi:MAG: YbhB/YbcL family Raf kinase inhibitor-like protein [Acidilobaceae archaeon]